MNYTTLEQSKKLVELGINPNTADMHIISYSNDRGGYFYTSLCYSKWDAEHTEGYFPCWSLGALLKIIPTKIGKHLDYWLTMETTTACNYVLFYKNIYSNEEICISSKNKNPLDSAVDLIKKLTKEGFLNTKGE